MGPPSRSGRTPSYASTAATPCATSGAGPSRPTMATPTDRPFSPMIERAGCDPEGQGHSVISRGQIALVALVTAVLTLLLAPVQALAQEKRDDVYVRVNGTVDLAAG